ncbi:MAG: DUF445 domain-containing protein [Rhodospirillales bacterium]|jgi:uncharacterized membrane protein YheB (UPF0754 family)|nr:DUF445 domain-containing protein [Rhodospirillales bacterium]MBT4040519.1 DUF445 domain-containing protein [Rhodospirillales bacterium]MBT4627190.1 DUF445 domain-containing protein [Rhodospirillales bacterium]MBT5351870.1 DUF445 domain-containing protein [Rhodospirillales bacterium]MBT5520578.1 DUF445 domain-containing protein [Rhodospirillales bacterium]
MNKSFLTNLIAAAVTMGGYLAPVHGDLIFMVGVFALSGGITNWIAIHMLFEKVPLLYGSGVIPNRFEDFKAGIKTLIVNEFFTREHIERFFQQAGGTTSASIIEKVDYDRVFAHLVEAIEQSSLGGMLSMVGGTKALEPLREPVSLKLKDIITELVDENMNGGSSEGGSDFTDSLIEKVEHIIDNRLDELTPENVKQIVQDMIRKHLGWLVVWGGVFGGSIGLVVGLLEAQS